MQNKKWILFLTLFIPFMAHQNSLCMKTSLDKCKQVKTFTYKQHLFKIFKPFFGILKKRKPISDESHADKKKPNKYYYTYYISFNRNGDITQVTSEKKSYTTD